MPVVQASIGKQQRIDKYGNPNRERGIPGVTIGSSLTPPLTLFLPLALKLIQPLKRSVIVYHIGEAISTSSGEDSTGPGAVKGQEYTLPDRQTQLRIATQCCSTV